MAWSRSTPLPIAGAGRVTPRRGWFALHALCWLALAVVVWSWIDIDYWFGDPIHYLMLAYDLTHATAWPMTHPFEHRLGLIAIHALSYALFDLGLLAAHLPQLLLMLGCMLALSLLARSHIELFFANLVAFWLISQTVIVVPDQGMGLFLFLAVICAIDRQRPHNGVGFALAAFVAFLFKELAVFIAFFWLALFVADGLGRRHRAFHLGAIGVGAALILLYALSYKLIWGSALARLGAVDDWGNQHYWVLASKIDLLRRLFLEPFDSFVAILGWSFVLSFFVGFLYVFRSFFHDERAKWIAIYQYIGIFYFVFASSSSLATYQPLPFFDRMLSFLIPGQAMLIGIFAAELWARLGRAYHSLRLALLATLTLICAQKTIEVTLRSWYQMHKSQLHEAMIHIADRLRANPDAVLLTIESSTPFNFPIYDRMQHRLVAQIRVCLPEAEINPKQEVLILLNYPFAEHTQNNPKYKTCIGAYEQLVAGQKPLITDSKISLYALTKP